MRTSPPLVAALPLLVTERFGIGAELVGSLALRLAPRILFAPVAANLIRRFFAWRPLSRRT